MNKKKIFAIVLAFIVAIGATAAITMALLTDEDEAVNVMTVGNVYIDQYEYERDTAGQLQEFTQNKPWLPVTVKPVGYDADPTTWEQIKAPGSDALYDSSVEGIQDKFVFVKNTGTTDAYVRTIIAYECPEGFNAELLHINDNSDIMTQQFYTKIGGVQYLVREYIYPQALTPGEVSRPSLLQVYLDYDATNEDVELFNGQMDILAVSQAVQSAGFGSAKEALEEAFGAVTPENHPWTDGVPALGWTGEAEDAWYDAAETEFVITSADELAGLAEMVNAGNTFRGKTVKLAADINLGNRAWTPIGHDGDTAGFQGVFDGQGHTISNLNVNLSERAYQAAGLFGSVRYATLKNFKVVNATINNLDDSGNTDNGAAVIVGAAQIPATIDNVDVENATVTGNRRVAAIAGYYVGTITNCDVKDVQLTATFDELGDGEYDNCDKVGGIIAYSNGASTITGNTVKDSKISGYRDVGGIAGYATTSTLTNNAVENVEITIANNHNYKNYATTAEHDVNAIIGEGTADETNTATNVTIVSTTSISTAEELKAALSADAEHIVITLADDISINIGTSWKLGGAQTKSITIKGASADTVLTLSSTYRDYFLLANPEGTLYLEDLEVTNLHAGTHFHDYTTRFVCDLVATNVAFSKAPLVDGTTAEFNNCSFYQPASNGYSLWVMSGSDVTVNGGTVDAARGIKIADEDSGAENTTLVVTGTKFNNTAKAAILATTNYGADITLSDIDISNCAADSINAVWVDEDREASFDQINVTGGTKIYEGDIADSNDKLTEAVAAGKTTIYLADGEYDLKGNQANGLTLIGLGKAVNVANTTDYAGNGSLGAIWRAINLKNVTVTGTVYTMAEGGASTFTNVTFAAGFRQGYGSAVVFDNCTFGSNAEGYALHFQTDSASAGGEIKLTGCEFLGGKVHLGGKRTYAFTSCEFAEGTDFQVWSDITLEGCTVNGTEVTAENMNTLFPNLTAEKVTIK